MQTHFPSLSETRVVTHGLGTAIEEHSYLIVCTLGKSPNTAKSMDRLWSLDVNEALLSGPEKLSGLVSSGHSLVRIFEETELGTPALTCFLSQCSRVREVFSYSTKVPMDGLRISHCERETSRVMVLRARTALESSLISPNQVARKLRHWL